MRMFCRRHCSLVVVSLLSAALLVGAVEAHQFASSPPETVPAQKAGWWVRVNPGTDATHVYWRFGTAADQLSAPMSWAREQSPEALDVPPDQRMAGQLHIASIGMPPAARVSFCVFFGTRGVALVEFTQETNLVVDQGGAAEQCVA